MARTEKSVMPTQKLSAATAAGALTILLVWVAGLAGLDVPPEVASAFTTLLAAVVGWLVPNAGTPGGVPRRHS